MEKEMQQILKETDSNLEKVEVKTKKIAENKTEKQMDVVTPEEWKNKYQILDKKNQEVFLLCNFHKKKIIQFFSQIFLTFFFANFLSEIFLNFF